MHAGCFGCVGAINDETGHQLAKKVDQPTMLMLQHAKLGNRAASLAALWARSGTATRNIADDALAKVVDKDLAAEAEKTGIPTITARVGQAFTGDLRSTSGVGLGDGLRSHTAKWLQVCQLCLLLYYSTTALFLTRLTTRHQ